MKRRAPRPRRSFWVGQAIGVAVIAFGLAGLLRNAAQTKPGSWLTFYLGALIVHDLLLAPIVFAVALVLARLVAPWARPAVQAGLLVTGVLVLVAIPVLGAWGRNPNNPSLLPGDPWRDLPIVLVAVWAVVAAILLRARQQHARADA